MWPIVLQEISEGKFRLEFVVNQGKLGEIEKKFGFRILMANRLYRGFGLVS